MGVMSNMRMKFMNIYIDNLTMNESIIRIEELIKQNKNAYVVTPNVDHIVRVENDEEFRKIYHNADMVLTDGQPLIWISKFYRTPIKEKISGSDLFPMVCKLSAEKKYKIFFLGAGEGVASRAAINLKKKYKNLQVVGTYSPPFGFENDKEEIDKIISILSEKSIDILVLGLGTPKQEKFFARYKEKINVPITFGFGASLDFEAGNIKRAPKWISKIGFEWLYRLCKDPKRMFKRYIIDDTKIFKLIFKYRIRG